MGPSFGDLAVSKGNLRPSSHLHPILDATQTPAEVFSFSKRQLQQPARDRIAARHEEDQAVLAM